MYVPGSSYNWEQFLTTINKEIMKKNPTGLNSEDKQLGIYFVSENGFLIIIEIQDNDGKTIIVPIKINGKGSYNNLIIDENQIKSVSEFNDITSYLQYNEYEKIYTKKGTTLNEWENPTAISKKCQPKYIIY